MSVEEKNKLIEEMKMTVEIAKEAKKRLDEYQQKVAEEREKLDSLLKKMPNDYKL